MTGVGAYRLNCKRAAVSKALAGLGVATSLVFASSAGASGDANRTVCAQSTESSSGYVSYLPDCRSYELVSPPYRQGGVIMEGPAALSSDGESAIVGIAGASGGAENESYDFNRSGDIDVYRLSRSADGWRYLSLTPSAMDFDRSALLAASADPALAKTLWGAQKAAALHKEDIYVQEAGGSMSLVGPGEAPGLVSKELAVGEELNLAGASQDLSHDVFAVKATDNHTVWPGDTTQPGSWSLYEYEFDGTPIAEPRLVGVSNQGMLQTNSEANVISSCGTELGSAGGDSAYNAVSADGKAVFFTARACGGGPVVDEVYARIDGSSTVPVSEPSKADCEVCDTTNPRDAHYQGASNDGMHVFFTTEQELLPGQTGSNLYEYSFDGPDASPAHPDGKITLVSFGASNPEVQGVARISEDGSRVYFVAKEILTTAPYASDRLPPEAGADNLYAFTTSPAGTGGPSLAFVARLLTATEEMTLEAEEAVECCGAGTLVGERAELAEFAAYYQALSEGSTAEEAATDAIEALQNAELTLPGTIGPLGTVAEDTSVWQAEDRRPVQSTPDGDVLVFPSSAHLTGIDSGATVPQLFRYDARTGELAQVSAVGERGQDISRFHEAPQLPAQGYEGVVLQIQDNLPTTPQFQSAIARDGEMVLFTSAAPLTDNAVAGTTNVYEYREGEIYLISDGKDGADAGTNSPAVQLTGADPSGRDVFFTTADKLVPEQGDSQQALYDAREEGGFPRPTLTSGCIAETCRGANGEQVVSAIPITAGQSAEAVAPARLANEKSIRVRDRRMQKLKKALAACSRRPLNKRRSCRLSAQRRYGRHARSTAHGDRRTK